MDLTAELAGSLPPADTSLQIIDLYARYNLSVDLGDVAGWARCFTDDGQFVIDGHTEWARSAGVPEVDLRGAAQLTAFMGEVAEERSVRHWTSNLVLRQRDANAVSGMSLMTVWDLAAARAGEVVLTGVMRDHLVHDVSGWRFRRRHLHLDK